jgi:bacteriorhodopsin
MLGNGTAPTPGPSYSTGHEMFAMTDGQFQTVYNSLSLTLAAMMASTIYFWTRLASVKDKYRGALSITALVTFIAGYHYFRIFNSWTDAYTYEGTGVMSKTGGVYIQDPRPTGKPFNDAYRYMDWLLTVPLLLIEIVFVMKLSAQETFDKALKLGVASALMIIIGYPGELILDQDHISSRWGFWIGAMIPFLFVVYTLVVSLRAATENEEDDDIKQMIYYAQYWTVISWCTYPIVYVLPMFGIKGGNLVVGIQVGYCISDIISKCGVGLFICNITVKKSAAKKDALLEGQY